MYTGQVIAFFNKILYLDFYSSVFIVSPIWKHFFRNQKNFLFIKKGFINSQFNNSQL